jgi:hypothetical protein
MYASSLEENPGLKLETKVQEVRFLTPDVARVEGQTRLTTDTGDASEYARYSGLVVKKEGMWLVAEIREYPAPAEDVSSYDRLKELEWMVGDWVAESDNVKASSTVRWADNKSFLIRTYQVEVKGEKTTSGTVFMGWDPQTGQIKSWLFDSVGGHGERLWTRTGEKEWVVKAQGVLRDGRPTSATQIHVVLNKDSVRTSSSDRIIGGQVVPDIADVVMVRKPPQPGGAPSRPAAAPAQPGGAAGHLGDLGFLAHSVDASARWHTAALGSPIWVSTQTASSRLADRETAPRPVERSACLYRRGGAMGQPPRLFTNLPHQFLDCSFELRVAPFDHRLRVVLDFDVGIDAVTLDDPAAVGRGEAELGDIDHSAVDQRASIGDADHSAPRPLADQ